MGPTSYASSTQLTTRQNSLRLCHYVHFAGGTFSAGLEAFLLRVLGVSGFFLVLSAAKHVQAAPLLAALDEVVRGLLLALEARVYVSLCRGLWDLSAKDIYTHLCGMQNEGEGVKVSFPVSRISSGIQGVGVRWVPHTKQGSRRCS